MSAVEITLHGSASGSRPPAGFSTICGALYEDAFPLEQRLSPEVLEATLATGDRRLYLAYEDDVPRGFGVVFSLGRDVVLLEYLAVEAASRSCGIGSALFTRVWEAEVACGASSLYLEIEDPAEPGLSYDVLVLRRRRVEFYRRNEAHVLPWRLAYSAPPFGTSRERPRYELLARTQGPPPSFSEATGVLAAIARYSYTPPYTAPHT